MSEEGKSEMKLTSVAVEKWRIVAAFFAATVSFLLLTLAAFIGSDLPGVFRTS